MLYKLMTSMTSQPTAPDIPKKNKGLIFQEAI